MNASDLIAEFSQRARLPSLTLSSEGTARLIVDETLSVDIEHDDAQRQLHLYTSLGQPPLDEREAFYARVLVANFFGRATGGATLALDPANTEILLVRTLDLEATDGTAFEAALQALVAAHERLSAEWLGANAEGGSGAMVSEAERNLMMRA